MEKNYKDIFKKHFEEHLDDASGEEMYASIKVRRKRRRRGPRRKKKSMLIIIPIVVGLGFLITTVIKNIQAKKSERTELKSSPLNRNTNKAQANVTQMQTMQEEIAELQSVEVMDKDLTEVRKETSILSKQRPNSTNEKSELVSEEGMQEAEINVDSSLNQDDFKYASANEKEHEFESKTLATDLRDDLVDSMHDQVSQKEIASNQEMTRVNLGSQIGRAEEALQSAWMNPLPSLGHVNAGVMGASRIMPVIANGYKIGYNGKLYASFKTGLRVQAGSAIGLFTNGYRYNEIEVEEYVGKRDESESSLEAVSGHILLEYQFHKNISISSGVGYTRFNELFEWKGAFVEPREGEYVSGIEKLQDGQENFVYQVGAYEALVDRELKVYNKTDLVYIPVYLNFKKDVGALNYSVYGGVRANIVTHEEGYILNRSLKDELINAENASEFGLGFSGGVVLEYPICRKVGMKFNAAYTHQAKDQEGITVHYDLVDVGLALVYQF